MSSMRKLKKWHWRVIVVVALLLIGVATGNKRQPDTTAAGTTTTATTTTTPAHATHTDPAKTHRPSHHPQTRLKPRPRPRPRPKPVHVAGLLVSAASGEVVQPQPAPGSCHARGSGQYSLPDLSCTPGAVNPDITPTTINQTICVSGWTATVRPSESITSEEKLASLAAYGDGGSPGEYEYDHLVPLELGGAVNDARNLWPEPGGVPNLKDSVENALREAVCSDQMSLRHAQQIIATDWVSYSRREGSGSSSTATTTSAPHPATSTQSQPGAGVPTVHPGAFCAPEGQHGVSVAGTPMVCGPASDGRNRWHSG